MNTTIEHELQERIYDTLIAAGLPLHDTHNGLAVAPDADRDADYYQPVWLVDGKAVIRANPAHADHMKTLISATDFSPESIIEVLKPASKDVIHMKLYALDADRFTPFVPDARYTVRQLTEADAEAFAAFQTTCSESERDEGDVGLDNEVVFGVLDGARIVAVASTYELWGFVDIGVLTAPDYRQQGLGKAAVSAVCEHYQHRADDKRIVLYRHDSVNHGSSGIARGLNFQPFASMVYGKFA